MVSLPEKEINLPYGFKDPIEYLKALVLWAEKFQWLHDLHIVDFFTHEQWNMIDQEWRLALEQEENWFDTVIQLPSFEPVINPSWPDTLKEYIHETHRLSLLRVRPKNEKHTQFKKHMLFGMTGKKIHEVERMSDLIQQVAKQHGISSALDLGSGQGYLSRALAFHHDMNVLAVDMSEIQTKGAERFDRRVIRHEEKYKEDQEGYRGRLTHITELITPDNILSVLTRWGDDQDDSSHDEDDPKKHWLICGLHTCGDLSTLIMRLFATENDKVSCLVNVGCCYHYLTEKPGFSFPETGFPMSDTLAKMNFIMGTTARVLACHSPWQWVHQKQASKKSFEQHFFRALLQKIMVDKGLSSASKAPPLAHRINKKNGFTGYVQAALKKFGMSPDSITAEEADQYLEEYKYAEKQITILWTLRSLLAPVLESIVLVDRWLYLKEAVLQKRPLEETQIISGEHDGLTKNNNAPPSRGVWMWPLFDPLESPRNIVFVASK
ncbi:methyltransferase domain-containing protein [Phascolomyces articulosus]|uniref:Methyltransferase domain-containing protein n=1 Tax=Phascolomyces articulosus TaxID=60185 RepID=A0AAD5K3T5_9FUNG|nr:methyltransferase domain-containing protein [Phascolomyces articulosus]